MTALLAHLPPPLRLVDLILFLVAAEAAVLLLRRRGRLLLTLLAGAALLLALRCALAGSGRGALAGCLALAGAAHLADLRARWRAGAADAPRGRPARRPRALPSGTRRAARP